MLCNVGQNITESSVIFMSLIIIVKCFLYFCTDIDSVSKILNHTIFRYYKKGNAMRFLQFLLFISLATGLHAQVKVTENRQHCFPASIPAGNYSGITWLGGNRYAVVSDKSVNDGFFVFEIDIDSVSGEILTAKNTGFHFSGYPGRDNEGITYVPQTHTLWISGEDDNRIREYDMDGKRTSRVLPQADAFRHLPANLGLEALSYNEKTQTFWTCNEAGTIHLQAYDLDMKPLREFIYPLDAPEGKSGKAQYYAHGIGTICALDDGSVLILEREFFVPQSKIGAWVNCKLYQFTPGRSEKQLVSTWRTSLSLFGRSIANYEGSCLGPTLADGSRVMILVADSQNQFAGALRDWLKSLKIEVPR